MIAILDNIRSAHNVGAIFRTADGAGVRKLYLCGVTPTPIDRFGRARKDVRKVALGAEVVIPWEYASSTEGVVRRLKNEGFVIVALEQVEGAISFDAFLFDTLGEREVALVLGEETRGLAPDILAHADYIVEIPMRGVKESLNVSVAFGIAAYVLCVERGTGSVEHRT